MSLSPSHPQVQKDLCHKTNHSRNLVSDKKIISFHRGDLQVRSILMVMNVNRKIQRRKVNNSVGFIGGKRLATSERYHVFQKLRNVLAVLVLWYVLGAKIVSALKPFKSPVYKI